MTSHRSTVARASRMLRTGAIALAAATALWGPSHALAQSHPGKLGVGLDGIGGKGMEFIDMVKTTRAWEALAGGDAPVDAAGWPTTDFKTVLFDHRPVAAWLGDANIDDPARYQVNMTGTYKMRYTGQATVTVVEGAVTLGTPSYNSSTNTTTQDITVSGPIVVLQFAGTKRTGTSATNTGLTNIRVMRPGYAVDATQLFHTPFTNCISSANFSVLRFMDWTHTNNSNPTYPATTPWSDRSRPGTAVFHKGAPWEYCVALGNQMNKDIWINVPVAATDDYVTKLAQLVRYGSDGTNPYTTTQASPVWAPLNSARTVYVEYSNEVWNWGFWQSQWNNSAGEAAGRNYIKQYAHRSAQISNIFRTVFGAGAMNGRVKVVNCWQVGWNPPDAQYEEQMAYVNGAFGAPNTIFWGLGVAPYFNEAPTAGQSVQSILDEMQASSDSSKTGRSLVGSVASKWGLKLLAYEGGPDNGGGDTTNVGNRILANRDARMRDLIIRDLDTNFFTIPTADIFCYFTMTSAYSRYGCWGATDDVTNPDRNYKFAGIRAVTGGSGTTTPPPPPPPPSTPPPPPPPSGGTGTISRDVWNSVAGTAVSAIPVGTTPSSSGTLTSLEGPTNAGDNYGQRVRGYVTAPTTGSYTFWVASDDDSELWIGTNDQPSTKVKVASVTGWTNAREWGKYTTQKSAARSLTAGTRYYIEALMKEGTGGDNLAVGWAKPGEATTAPSQVIPGAQLSPYAVAAPGAVTNLVATPGNAQVALSWSAASGATSYKVYYSTGGNYYQAASGITTTSYAHTGLTNGQQYQHYVVGTNAGGDGAQSNVTSSTPTAGSTPPPPPPPPSGGTGTGLKGEYFNNKTLATPVALTRTDGTVNFSWTGSPGTGVNADSFSVKWTGQVEAPTTGSYTFQTVSDDGIRLWVNGTQVINNWTDHGPTTDNSGAVSLTGGTKYNLTLEFYEATGGAEARLRWVTPGTTTAVAIPQTRLYPAGGSTPPPPPPPPPSGGTTVTLANPGYETGNGNGWVTGGGIAGFHNLNPRTGSWNYYNGGQWNNHFQNVAVQANAAHTLGVWAKLSASAGVNNYRIYYSLNGGTTKTYVNVGSASVGAYGQVTASFNTGSATSVQVGIEHNGTANAGECYLDDWTLVRN